MTKASLIVAGGIGSRYQSSTPKQFTKINNFMVIEYTVNAFLPLVDHIMITVPEDYLSVMNDHYYNNPTVSICMGGKVRQESVFLGLQALQPMNPQYVAIHDAARPIIDHQLITNSFETAQKFDSAVPVIDISDSLWQKKTSQTLSTAIDRNNFVLSQTPQTFHFQKILEAHYNCQNHFEEFSDCAGVYVQKFEEIYTFPGNKNNIKLTTSHDLLYISFLISKYHNKLYP